MKNTQEKQLKLLYSNAKDKITSASPQSNHGELTYDEIKKLTLDIKDYYVFNGYTQSQIFAVLVETDQLYGMNCPQMKRFIKSVCKTVDQ